MSYKVAQIKDNNVSSRIQPITINKMDVNVESAVGIVFTDIGYNVGSSSLSAQENYYLNFSVRRLPTGTYVENGTDYSQITFGVYLLSQKGNIYELSQSLGNYTVNPYIEGDSSITEEDKIVNFELIFSPKQVYNYIGFVISRNTYDYMKGNEGARRLPLIVAPDTKQPTLGQLINFFSNVTATKIGVQSRPGLLMCINGEPIRIGRSGVYEINNGYPIKTFNIPSDDRFILDYAYDG